MELSKRIRARREELNLSQDELAKLLGYKSRSTIAKIESGENDLSQTKIEAFAKALQTTTSYLMGWDSPVSENIESNNRNLTLSPKEERDISNDVEKMLSDLANDKEIAFQGEPMDDEEREALRIYMENALQLFKQTAKTKLNRSKK